MTTPRENELNDDIVTRNEKRLQRMRDQAPAIYYAMRDLLEATDNDDIYDDVFEARAGVQRVRDALILLRCACESPLPA